MNIPIRQLYEQNDYSQYLQVKDYVESGELTTWEDYLWSGLYLEKCTPDGTLNELIVDTLEESFFKGLTYEKDSECYLKAIKELGKIYLDLQQYDLALNMYMMLSIKDSHIPSWVKLRAIYAQLHTNTARRLLDDPDYFFSKMDEIQVDDALLNQRNMILMEYAETCIEGITDKDRINRIKGKLLLYKDIDITRWRQLGVQEDSDNASALEDIYENSEYETFDSLKARLEEENKEYEERIAKLEKELAESLDLKEKYEKLLAEKKIVTKELNANEICIEDVARVKSYGITDGHSLIEGNKKILVIGQASVGTDKMIGIVKQYGYDKKDYVFWNDYEKIKSYADRLSGGSFVGIIAGPMPHKVGDLGDNSSLIEKMKQPGYPYMVEAREEGGTLKLSKSSFRKAVEGITRHLIAIQ